METPYKPKSTSMDDERTRPDSPDQATFFHHLARYRFALEQVREGDHVLDVGCGAGYGAHLLSEKAAYVLGVDYSEFAVRYAREHFQRPNLTYAQMDAMHLGLRDARFDLVISFEVF